MSFPRYPRYKDSGVEWLGEVPEHWEIRRMKQCIARLYSGGTPDSGNSAFWAEDGDPESTAWVAIGDMTRSPLVNSTDRRLTKAGRESKRLDVVPAGTLLYSIYASLGKVAVLDVDATINQAIIGIAPDPQIISREFLRYWLLHVEQFLGVHSSSNTQDNLSAAKVRSLTVIAPPRAEQDEVVQLLDSETTKIDELIAEQQRLIELLNEKRQAVISHAVTRGLNPDAPLKPSGIEWLGDVPAHWRVVPLKRVAEVRTGVAKGKDHGSKSTVYVPYLRVANVQEGYLDLTDVAKMEIPTDELERFRLRVGDVLMNEGGDFDKLGRGHVWEGQIEPCITQNHVFAVRPKGISSAWLSTITSSSYAQFYFMGRSKQSTNLASISSTNLMELPVLLPPESEQEEILSFVHEQKAVADALTTQAERAISLLQERRTALISAAVTGKIDVRGLAQPEAA